VIAPNIAKPTTNPIMQAIVKTRLRNSRSGNTGSTARRSTAMSPTNSMAAAMVRPTIGGERALSRPGLELHASCRPHRSWSIRDTLAPKDLNMCHGRPPSRDRFIHTMQRKHAVLAAWWSWQAGAGGPISHIQDQARRTATAGQHGTGDGVLVIHNPSRRTG
jgi:hypothetical protein